MSEMRLFGRPETSVLMVCTANICRSPMAAGVLRQGLQQRGLKGRVRVESAGTHTGQSGRAPDPRAQLVCAQYGIDIGKHRARQVIRRDFERFNYVLSMDGRNYEWLVQACPDQHLHKITAIGSWIDGKDAIAIPDPYYGNQQGFEQVFHLLHEAVEGFLAKALTG